MLKGNIYFSSHGIEINFKACGFLCQYFTPLTLSDKKDLLLDIELSFPLQPFCVTERKDVSLNRQGSSCQCFHVDSLKFYSIPKKGDEYFVFQVLNPFIIGSQIAFLNGHLLGLKQHELTTNLRIFMYFLLYL